MTRLHHAFSVEHAEKYGVDCAILILHFQFWIEQNAALGRNFHDGRTWMYQTQAEIAACYPYWNRDKVQDILTKLVEFGVIIKGNYNKTKFDKTLWYAFENEEMFTKGRNRTIEQSISPNPKTESAQTIPVTKPGAKQKQQQQGEFAAAVFSEKDERESKKPMVYAILETVDIPQSQKLKLTRMCDEETVINAVGWATHPKNPPRKSLVASIVYACNDKLSIAEFDQKKKTPYEMVKEHFEHNKKYNGATCTLTKEAIAFTRTMKYGEVKFDKFFKWEKVINLCESFGISFNFKDTA